MAARCRRPGSQSTASCLVVSSSDSARPWTGPLRYASAHGYSSRRIRPLVRRSSPSGRRRRGCFPTPRSTERRREALHRQGVHAGVSEPRTVSLLSSRWACSSPRHQRSVLLASRRRLASSIGRWCAGSASATARDSSRSPPSRQHVTATLSSGSRRLVSGLLGIRSRRRTRTHARRSDRRLARATAAHLGRARLRERALRCDDESGASFTPRPRRRSRRHVRRRASLHRSAHGTRPRSRDVPRPVAEEPNKAGGFITASGRISTGQIAVRTLGGRQIAYVDVTDSGRRACSAGAACEAPDQHVAAGGYRCGRDAPERSAGPRGDGRDANARSHLYMRRLSDRGGVYLVETHAHAGTRRAGAWARLPYASIRTGAFSGGAGNLLAWITSGKPTPETMIDQDYDTFDVKTFGTVGVRRESCRPTSLRVPLAIDALIGGVAPPLGGREGMLRPEAGRRPRSRHACRPRQPETGRRLRVDPHARARSEARGSHTCRQAPRVRGSARVREGASFTAKGCSLR